MTALQLGGVHGSGVAALDTGLTDGQVVTVGDTTLVITASGAAGGLVAYAVGADGQLSVTATRPFPAGLQPAADGRLATLTLDGTQVVAVGSDAGGLVGYRLEPDGSFGARRDIGWTTLADAARADAPGALQAWARFSDAPVPMLGDAGPATALQTLATESGEVVLTLDADNARLLSYHGDERAVSPVGVLGAEQGLGIATPTAMATATVGGQCFALVASAQGSAISVIAVSADGVLAPVQQLIDTAATRFRTVQDLAVAQIDDHVLVAAVGADHGVTLLRMLPDGRLVHLESLSTDRAGTLDTPTSVSVEIAGDTLHLFVGTQNGPGLVQLTADVAGLGVVRDGEDGRAARIAGGAGDDVLQAGPEGDTLVGGAGADVLAVGRGAARMTGGAGADVFVMGRESTRVEITDFRAGTDRLDLSALPMLRDVAQLQITPTANGATLQYRDTEIVLTAADGRPLDAAALFPNGLGTPDVIPLLPPDAPPAPPPDTPGVGDLIEGTNTHNFLTATAGADTVLGARGNDTLRGLDGDDVLHGGRGHDRIWAGAGNDTLNGGPGNERMGGGPGNDLLYAGAGDDTLYAAAGDDTLFGESGTARLWGGHGDDSITAAHQGGRIGAGADNDTVIGGAGNDTIYGGAALGNDSILGGAGDDIIFGGVGDDTIFGGAGDDNIGGVRGDDRIDGGPGDDTVRGAPGADTFVFGPDDDTLRIDDFDFAEGDMIELDSALWGGARSVPDVLAHHARVADGSAVLDFAGGDVLTVTDIDDLSRLADHIVIV